MPAKSLRAPPARITLGIDPGIAITGYAVLREHRGTITLLTCNVIRTPKHLPLPDRLELLYQQIRKPITKYHPTESAMELLFFGRNRTTAMQVSHARGVNGYCSIPCAIAAGIAPEEAVRQAEERMVYIGE